MFKKIFFLTLFVFSFLGCQEKESKEIFSYLPNNIQLLAQFSHLEESYQGLGILEDKFFTFPLKHMQVEWAKEVGVNFLDLKDLKNKGLNPSGAAGIAFLNFEIEEKENIIGSLYFDALNTDKLIQEIKAIFLKNMPQVQFQEEDNFIVFTPDSKSSPIYVFAQDSFVFITFADPKNNAKNFALSIKENKNPLSQAPQFNKVYSKIQKNKSFFLYTKTLSMVEQFYQMLDLTKESIEKLKEFESLALSVDLKSPHFKIDTALLVNSQSLPAQLLKNPISRSSLLQVKDPALLLILISLNPSAIADFLQKELKSLDIDFFEEIKPTIKELNQTFDLDFNKDIAQNLNGNFNLGVFDGKGITAANHNTVISLGIKDEVKMQEILDKIIKNLPQEFQSMIKKDEDKYIITIHGMVQFFLKIQNKNLLIVSGNNLAPQVFQKQDPSLVATLPHPWVKEGVKEKGQFFYLNIDQLVFMLKNFAPMIPDLYDQNTKELSQGFLDMANLFSFFGLSQNLEEDVIAYEAYINTRFKKPFIKSLSKIISDLN